MKHYKCKGNIAALSGNSRNDETPSEHKKTNKEIGDDKHIVAGESNIEKTSELLRDSELPVRNINEFRITAATCFDNEGTVDCVINIMS